MIYQQQKEWLQIICESEKFGLSNQTCDAIRDALDTLAEQESEIETMQSELATLRQQLADSQKDAEELRNMVEDAADEWALYVEVDTAPVSLKEHMLRAFDAAMQKDQSND